MGERNEGLANAALGAAAAASMLGGMIGHDGVQDAADAHAQAERDRSAVSETLDQATRDSGETGTSQPV